MWKGKGFMKKWLLFILAFIVCFGMCVSFAEEKETKTLVDEVGNLILQATPEERF